MPGPATSSALSGTPNGSAPLRAAAAWPQALARGLPVVAILAVSLALRVPYLYNSTATFNSDEAVNALALKHMLAGDGITLHSWDTYYYGIVESLLALPFVAVAGFRPVAFELGALVGFALLVLAVFLLGSRVYGRREGLLASLLVAVFSPQVVAWSSLASSGFTLIVAWGTLTILVRDGLVRPAAADLRQGEGGAARAEPPWRWRFAALGLMCGFGYYMYELYVVYLAALVTAWLPSSFAWRWLRSPNRLGPLTLPAVRRDAASQLRAGLLLLAGFAVGWWPRLVTLARGARGGRAPVYAPADLATLGANLRSLFGECVPALFGFPAGGAGRTPLLALLVALIVLVYALAWGAAARRVARELFGVVRNRAGALGSEAFLVWLVPLTALLFALSRNPGGVEANRFLLPWLSALPLFAAALIVRLGRWQRAAGWALGALLLGAPALAIASWYQARGYLDARLQLRRVPVHLPEVVSFLRRAGLRGGYGDYWSAYAATFLSGEAVVIAPYDWDRYPPYTRYVDRLPAEAYLFDLAFPPARQAAARMPARLRAAGARAVVRDFGNYRVFVSPRPDRRLLPPRVTARPLAGPHGAIRAAAAVPRSVRAGAVLKLPVTVANLGNEAWSAQGIAGSGVYRVDVSYRWLDEHGRALPGEGRRTLLPADVLAGAALPLTAEIPAPPRPGHYRLVLTLVQEGVAWFDQLGAGAARYDVEIDGAAGAAPSRDNRPGVTKATDTNAECARL
jgi:hypothetical protein